MPITKVSQDLGDSWWVHTIALVEAGTTNILHGGVRSDGDPRIFRRAPGEDYTNQENQILFNAPEADDHNGISILSEEDKDLIVFWQRHGLSNILNYWKCAEGATLSNLSTKLTIEFPDVVTYHQAVSIDDTIYGVVRCGASTWYAYKSTDWLATTPTPFLFFDGSNEGGQMYMNIQPKYSDPTIVQLAIYGHPTGSPWRDVIYGELDLSSGDISTFGSTVSNIADIESQTTTPLNTTSLDTVFTPDPLVAGQKVRLLDVGELHGTNVVLLARWNDVTIQPQYYVYHQTGTGAWTPLSWISSGGTFNDGGGRKYVGGMALDRSGLNKVYISYKDPTWHIRKYQINSNMTLGTNVILQSNSNYPLIRPYAVRGKEACIWGEARVYNTFTDYLIHRWLYEF